MKIKIVLLFMSGVSFFGYSQDKVYLTAQEAVVTALENNYQMLIASKQNEIAVKNNKWSEAGAFPTIDLTAGIGNSIIDNTNNPFTFTPGLIATQNLSPGISLNWNLFAGMAVRMSKKRLEELENQSRGNGLLLLENTTADVLQAYYTVILQQERLNLAREVYQISIKQVDYEEKRASYGQTNRLAIFQSKNQLFNDSLTVIQQKLNVKNSLRNLMLLMNVPEDDFLTDNFPVLLDSLAIPLAPIETDHLIEQVQQNNQTLKNQSINLALQKASTKLQRSFLYPVISLQAGAAPSYGNFRALGDSDLNVQTQQITYFGNINIRYSLFNNWKDKRAVEVAKIQEEIAELNLEDVKKQVVSTTFNLMEMYDIRNQLVNVSMQNMNYAKLAYEVGLERFELGALNSLDLTKLKNAYTSAKTDYFDMLYQRLDAYIELLKITGKLQLEYALP